jgi:NADH:ubiquinone oxidoreductase subunit 6 (subunit J)
MKSVTKIQWRLSSALDVIAAGLLAMLAAAIATFLLFTGMGFNRDDSEVPSWFVYSAYLFWIAALATGMYAEARRLSKKRLQTKIEIESEKSNGIIKWVRSLLRRNKGA